MSINEQKLIFRLKQLGLQEGSKSLLHYEKAKKMLRALGLSPAEFENAIRITTNHLKCEL